MPRRDHGYGFGGPRERDGEAGLDDFNARDLQTRTGRMNAPDPLFAGAMGDPQGWNRYAYVHNNPLVFTDPTGMILTFTSGVEMNGMLTPLTPIGLAVFKTTGADGGEFGSMSGNERAGWDGAEAGPDGGAGGGDGGQQPGIQSPPPPGPDPYTDPEVKREAITTLTGTEVRSLQRSNRYNEIFCAPCRNPAVGNQLFRTDLLMRRAGDNAAQCPWYGVKVADLHTHPWLFGNWRPTPGEGSPGIPNFVWTPYNGGVVWQYNQSGFWGVFGTTPTGFISS